MATTRKKTAKCKLDSHHFNDFFNGYIGAALWNSTDEHDQPLEVYYDKRKITKASLAKMKSECVSFVNEILADLEAFVAEVPRGSSDGGPWSLAGYCFWMNRNHAGVGFWDRGVDEALGERLSNASHKYGESNLSVYRKRVYVD